MEFRILGALEVTDDGHTLALGGPKQRAVLAHLILRANRVVPAELLIDGLWGEDPPESARTTLQTYVYRLRKLLGDGRIEGRDGGYVLLAGAGEIDADRFEALVRRGKAQVASDPAAAAATLADALSLWRADALADVTEEPSLRGEAARLEELRLSATEHRVAAEIAMGGHSGVVPELESLTARYPLRERMWANLMLALYRSGRQAEALSRFERARRVLVEELGADPSPELRRLHEQILHGAAALGAPEPEPERPTVRASRVDLQPGTEVAGYRIERTLGRGGMSVVYLAEHDWLQRNVALKVLAPQLAEDERFRERFVRESRLAASLDHPNVIPIYEAGASGGDLFIAMRYVEGTDLRTLLHDRGALEPERAVDIVRQVAAALDAAHEQGLVHRDVKPGNVLLARQRGSEAGEHVYLSDFGLTKRSVSDSGITGTGQFVGTLDYAAPEQFRGGTPDARTDVYCLGCVLFECLTGRPPFQAENDAALMYAHLQEPPPSITAVRPELPAAIDGVMAKAMAKTPADRHPTAGALAAQASTALRVDAYGAPTRTKGSRRLRTLVGALGLTLALVAGVLIATALRDEVLPGAGQGQRPTTVSPSPPRPPAFQTVDRALGAEEGRLLGYVPDELSGECSPLDRDEPFQGEIAALVCRTADVEVLYELFPTRDLMDAAFQINVNNKQAPEGECATDRLAEGIYTIDGERAGRVLCYTVERGPFTVQGGSALPDQSHLEWTDENSTIYAHAVRNDLADLSLYSWWLASSGPVVSLEGGDPAAKDGPGGPRTRLLDGSYVTSPPGGCGGYRSETCAMDIEGDAYRLIFTIAPFDPVETGSILLQKPNNVVFAPRTGYCFQGGISGPPRSPRPAEYTVRTTAGTTLSFTRTGGGTCAGPQRLDDRWTRAPAGTIALEHEGELALMQPGGAIVEELATDLPTRPNLEPDWSPDGSTIVFAGAGETFDLYLSDVDGTGVTQLTDGAGDESFPAWSPDGSRIAFVTDDLGHPPEPFYDSIVVVDPSGGSRIELLTRRDEVFASPAWSPDGRRIAFSAYTQDGYVLYVMNADGTGVTEAHREPRGLFAMPVTWTPDGDRVVFWGSQDGRETLLSVRPDGTGLRVFLEDLPPFADTLELDWSPDERWIVAANVWDLQDPQSGSGPVIFLIRADGSEAFVVGVGGSGPTWRPEGR